MKRLVFLILFVALLAGLGWAGWFAWQNTSFLRFRKPVGPIVNNNQTTETIAPTPLSTLVSQSLQVSDQHRRGVFATDRKLNLPVNLRISVFAEGLGAPRFFDFDDLGALLVADKGTGQVVRVYDVDDAKEIQRKVVVLRGLRNVHSVDWFEGDLYVAEEHQITVLRDLQADGTFARRDTLVSGLPTGRLGAAGHVTRTVVVGPDRRLYVAVGSSCNLCEESNTRRAAVMRYNLDGTGEERFATGLRNSVGLAFQGDVLWGVDNGRDLLGDDLPPEELNRIEFGKHYGWPYCYGDRQVNPEYAGRRTFCEQETEAPIVEMQAHSAPLGLATVPDAGPLAAVAKQFLVAFHGSWNRTVPTGYKVVLVNPGAVPAPGTVNFITGWLEEKGVVWGRPVGVGFGPDGALYISDDKAGAIYRVTAAPATDTVTD